MSLYSRQHWALPSCSRRVQRWVIPLLNLVLAAECASPAFTVQKIKSIRPADPIEKTIHRVFDLRKNVITVKNVKKFTLKLAWVLIRHHNFRKKLMVASFNRFFLGIRQYYVTLHDITTWTFSEVLWKTSKKLYISRFRKNRALCVFITLRQGSPNYGPRAACGPWGLLIRLAETFLYMYV